MHSLIGKTPCSCGLNRKEQIVLIRCRIGQGRFTFYVDVFFPLSLPRLLTDFTVYMSNTGVCLIKSRNCLPFASTWVHPRFFAHLFSFLRCPIMYCYVLISMLWYPLRFRHKHDVRLFVGGLVSGLRYLFACGGVCRKDYKRWIFI